jgi:hypothetical protein
LRHWEEGAAGIHQLRSSEENVVKKRSVMNDDEINLDPGAVDKLFMSCKKNVLVAEKEPIRFSSAALSLLAGGADESDDDGVGAPVSVPAPAPTTAALEAED